MVISRILIVLILVWVSVCVTACAPSSDSAEVISTQVPTASATLKVEPTPSVIQRWLNGMPCAPPCWEGITPGVTTFTETLKIVENLPGTSNIKIFPDEESIALVADWTMPGDRAGIQKHSIDVSATPWEQGGIVTNFFLSLPKMRMDEVLASYGPPEYVQAVSETSIQPHSEITLNYWLIRLVWLSQGFEMSVLGSGDVPVLDRRFTAGEHVTYFVPGFDGYGYSSEIELRDAGFFPWQGYGALEAQAIRE